MSRAPNTLVLFVLFVLVACGSDRAPQPVTEAQATVAEQTEAEPVQEEPVPEEEACPVIVLASEVPLDVRAGPGADTAKVGELTNGTVATVSETRDAWARVSTPIEGWVKEGTLYDVCASPAAVPALTLGQRSYVLVTEWSESTSGAGVALPAPATESAMGFRRRDARPLTPPTPVTLVTRTGSCVREASRRIVLIGHCPGERESQVVSALEVESCPELPADEGRPPLVALLGRHEGAVLEDWAHAEAPTREPQRGNIARYIQTEADVPETMTRFGDSEFAWVAFEDRLWLMRGDDVLDILDEGSSPPMRIRKGDQMLAAVGNAGEHELFMFPNASTPEQARVLGYPDLRCN